MFADDICVFAPTLRGLQRLLDVCCAYAVEHEIVFNYKKTVGMVFECKKHKCLA